MADRYDTVVVGAGLGGLSAATYLAKRGQKVLLLERHNIPGGYATSFVRGRYEFEIALHELSGIGPPERRGALYRYLEQLGVAEHVEFVQARELYRSVFPDLDVVLPVGREAYEERLIETFPHEADGIRRFMRRIAEVNREIGQFAEKNSIGNPLTAPARFKNIVRYLPATWGQVLHRDIADVRARAVISQYWGYFGLGPSAVSFLWFAGALGSYTRLGAAHVKGRSQALSNAFVRAFEGHGGEARFSTGVRSITVRGGRVTGVVTDGGDALEADRVVSNADPITTCRELISEDLVPRSFFASLRARRVSPSSLNVYMGVACPPEELGLATHENFVNDDYDFDVHHNRLDRLEPPKAQLVTCYNAVLPDISPPGTSMVVLTTLYYGEPWCNVPASEYVDLKNRLAGAMIDKAERIAPGLRRHTEVVEVATPVTNMRHTGSLTGSIYGFGNPAHDHTVLRLDHRGPLPGLYFAGAWTQPGGGFEPTIMSGQMAAAKALKDASRG